MLFLLILPILNFLDLASFDPLLDVPVGGGGRDAESGGEFLICLAVKGFRESVEESLLACVCRCGGYGFFDLREGAENLVDVDYEESGLYGSQAPYRSGARRGHRFRGCAGR